MDLWTAVYEQFGDLAVDRHMHRCLNAVLANPHIASQLVDADRLVRRVVNGPRTYGSLFAEIGSQLTERAGKNRWGEQLALVERFAPIVFDVFPEARVVHMVRDPRDRAMALLQSSTRRGGVATATAGWIESVRLAARNESGYAGRYLVVRYESLLERPKETLHTVCDFVGIAYEPEMLAPVLSAARAGESGIGNFRDDLSSRQIAYIQTRAGPEMAYLAYPLEPIRLSRSERLHYQVVDLPINWSLRLLWEVRERMARPHMSTWPAARSAGIR
jgi:hypothetical protein